MKKKFFLPIVCFFFFNCSYAQIGIGTASPDPSSQLEIKSTTAGVLFPRLTNAEIAAIPAPADGLMVYNTDRNCLQTYSVINGTPTWDCVSNIGRTPPVFIDDTRQDELGFTGTYIVGESPGAFGAQAAFQVIIENESFSPVTLQVEDADLSFSGDFANPQLVRADGAAVSSGDDVTIPGNSEVVFEFEFDGTVPGAGQVVTATFDHLGITFSDDLTIPGTLFSYSALFWDCTQPVANASGYSNFLKVDGDAEFNVSTNGDLTINRNVSTGSISAKQVISAEHSGATGVYRIGISIEGIEQRQFIYANSTFFETDIPNIPSFDYDVLGGGGGGGDASTALGTFYAGGGGSGGFASGTEPYLLGAEMIVFVGDGGLGGDGNADGLDGGFSRINYDGVNIANANGGRGGQWARSGTTRGNGGAGGTATIGDVLTNGNPGEGGDSGGDGGNTSAYMFLAGGPGGAGNNDGSGGDSISSGAGGGGAGKEGAFGNSARSGGDGAKGRVLITYACPTN